MPRKSEGLSVGRRPDTGALVIKGTVAGVRIRRSPQSNIRSLAEEEARVLEVELLRADFHGPRRGTRPFAEAVKLYVESEPRSQSTLDRLARLVAAMGETKLSDIKQDTINKVARRVLRPDAAPATKLRGVIIPVRAVMRLAADEGWCDPPRFRQPKRKESRTLFIVPSAAEMLLAAAGPALQVLIEFILGTGARMSEALECEWRDVDLRGAKVTLWKTKKGKRRVATMPPRLVAVLANLPYRDGRVIRRPDGEPYNDKGRQEGGQAKRAWIATRRRARDAGANIDAGLRLHDLRHSWASWYYAVHRDPMQLKIEGGWASLDQIGVYTHLLPQGERAAVLAFWHVADTDFTDLRTSA